ncbi:uncharacterized protein LOC143249603 [Tachypleus tridentatus]|uniref:uncharacterized protein LOC143249603 n=1 Tax=Tachypleus tridentatus TaxID=6853 RepID=UPI003FCF3A9C
MNEMKLILQQELKEISTDSCQFSDKMTHVFKSIGNWANPIMISDVITFAKKCPKQFMYKVLTVEALHFLSHMEEVQEWLLQVFINEDCEVQQTILKIISQQLSSVHDNRLYGRLKSEARKTFTYLDEYLGFILLNASESYVNCPSLLEEIYDYLEIKSAQQAKEIIFQVNEKEFQFTSSMSNRQKRWTSKNCHSWNFSKDYEIIQSKNEFENDNNLYSNKKHCLAYQQLGNSEIYGRFYAGYFVGATLPKYKLFAKIAGQGKFLSKKFEIGSAMFSLTNENSKFMLKILGKQLKKEETHDLCFNKTFSLYKSQYMSIYQLNIIVIRINLGFTVKPQLGITVNCNNHNYVFKPQALLGVGGYASAQILCVKAGMDADITFNYFLKAYLNIYPSMCYKFTHGYDPMMINFRIWYQVWLPFWWRGVNNWKKFTWRLGPGSEREILKQKQCWQNDVQHSISQTS